MKCTVTFVISSEVLPSTELPKLYFVVMKWMGKKKMKPLLELTDFLFEASIRMISSWPRLPLQSSFSADRDT